MSKIHINIDQSSLSGSSCMLRWKRVIIDGYKEPKNSRDITYGVAVHAFLDTMYQTNGDLAMAVEAAKKAFAIPSFSKPEKKHMDDPMHMMETCLSVYRDFVVKDTDFQLLNIRKPCIYCETKGNQIIQDDSNSIFI